MQRNNLSQSLAFDQSDSLMNCQIVRCIAKKIPNSMFVRFTHVQVKKQYIKYFIYVILRFMENEDVSPLI